LTERGRRNRTRKTASNRLQKQEKALPATNKPSGHVTKTKDESRARPQTQRAHPRLPGPPRNRPPYSQEAATRAKGLTSKPGQVVFRARAARGSTSAGATQTARATITPTSRLGYRVLAIIRRGVDVARLRCIRLRKRGPGLSVQPSRSDRTGGPASTLGATGARRPAVPSCITRTFGTGDTNSNVDCSRCSPWPARRAYRAITLRCTSHHGLYGRKTRAWGIGAGAREALTHASPVHQLLPETGDAHTTAETILLKAAADLSLLGIAKTDGAISATNRAQGALAEWPRYIRNALQRPAPADPQAMISPWSTRRLGFTAR